MKQENKERLGFIISEIVDPYDDNIESLINLKRNTKIKISNKISEINHKTQTKIKNKIDNTKEKINSNTKVKKVKKFYRISNAFVRLQGLSTKARNKVLLTRDIVGLGVIAAPAATLTTLGGIYEIFFGKRKSGWEKFKELLNNYFNPEPDTETYVSSDYDKQLEQIEKDIENINKKYNKEIEKIKAQPIRFEKPKPVKVEVKQEKKFSIKDCSLDDQRMIAYLEERERNKRIIAARKEAKRIQDSGLTEQYLKESKELERLFKSERDFDAMPTKQEALNRIKEKEFKPMPQRIKKESKARYKPTLKRQGAIR